MKKSCIDSDEKKLWNKNFILLWMGQLVSSLGDSFYTMALSVFTLDLTGSVAILGIVKSLSLIPRIIISPFAGAVVDANDRKKIIVLSDFISGIAIGLIFLAVIFGYKKVWILLVVGFVLGITSCFFDPAINSVIPDIVHRDNLVKANSSISMIYEGTNIIGSACAGILIKVIGVPLLFLFNSISFIFSATSEMFINIPENLIVHRKTNYFKDIFYGAKYVVKNKGLVYLYIVVSVLNFFGSLGFMLVLPYFKVTEGLGIGSYGISLSCSSIGLIIGFTILSKIDYDKANRYILFVLSGFITSIAMIMLVFVKNNFIAMVLLFFNGFGISITNSILQVTFQKIVPSELRGKVFGFKKMLGLLLVPIALSCGGALAEVLSIDIVLIASYGIMFILFFSTIFVKEIKDCINIA